jgi:hypothetical protein
MARNSISARGCVRAAVFIAIPFMVAPAQNAGGSFYPQQILDFMAKPLPASGTFPIPSTFPSHFADWTEEQKASGLKLIVQRCALMNAMAHDNPRTRILPDPMTMLEESGLAADVCLTANMPEDWPSKGKLLDDAQRLIAKANSHGVTLHVPVNLVRK